MGLEARIEDRLGVPREVITRTAAELRAAVDAHPFPVDEPRFSHIGFMADAPAASDVAAAGRFPTGGDAWCVIGRDLHIRYAHGSGRPDMNVDRLLRTLAQPMTARNIRTVRTLIERAC